MYSGLYFVLQVVSPYTGVVHYRIYCQHTQRLWNVPWISLQKIWVSNQSINQNVFCNIIIRRIKVIM